MGGNATVVMYSTIVLNPVRLSLLQTLLISAPAHVPVDIVNPCCNPGGDVVSHGSGVFESVSKTIAVPAGCDIQLCSVTFELVTQGIVYIDEVRLEWTS